MPAHLPFTSIYYIVLIYICHLPFISHWYDIIDILYKYIMYVYYNTYIYMYYIYIYICIIIYIWYMYNIIYIYIYIHHYNVDINFHGSTNQWTFNRHFPAPRSSRHRCIPSLPAAAWPSTQRPRDLAIAGAGRELARFVCWFCLGQALQHTSKQFVVSNPGYKKNKNVWANQCLSASFFNM